MTSRFIALTALLCIAGPGYGQMDACGDMRSEHFGNFGPFDYRAISPSDLSLVERNHFTPKVEQLIAGETSTIGGDLSYTLRAIPNHPRALAAMAKLSRKEKRPTPIGSYYSVECWFERAMRYRPDDANVRVVYGIELIRDGKNAAAVEQLKFAVQQAPDNANVHYNIGLAYFSLADYEQSLAHAKKAYELGFPLPGLRDKLKRAGKWKD